MKLTLKAGKLKRKPVALRITVKAGTARATHAFTIR